jgi:hypothetical protein|tara:strand:+ start:2394 stop:2699 length:306 start_codon:yes stop_codon:yes gene_type:complete
MDTPALAALNACISDWEGYVNISDASQVDITKDGCALCAAFRTDEGCTGCPVVNLTGKDFCEDTPYATAFNKLKKGTLPEFRAAAQDVLAFCKALLPGASG